MKHGIIIPFHNESSTLKLTSIEGLTNELKNVSICFVSQEHENTKKVISKFTHLTENIYFIQVKKETTKEDAVKKAAIFLFKKTDVDTIGFIDPEHAKSLSEYRALMETYGETDDSILSALKKVNAFDKHFEENLFTDILYRMLQGTVMLITQFRKNKEKCVAKIFSRQVIPYIFKKDVLTAYLFDSHLISGRKLQLNR